MILEGGVLMDLPTILNIAKEHGITDVYKIKDLCDEIENNVVRYIEQGIESYNDKITERSSEQ